MSQGIDRALKNFPTRRGMEGRGIRCLVRIDHVINRLQLNDACLMVFRIEVPCQKRWRIHWKLLNPTAEGTGL